MDIYKFPEKSHIFTKGIFEYSIMVNLLQCALPTNQLYF